MLGIDDKVTATTTLKNNKHQINGALFQNIDYTFISHSKFVFVYLRLFFFHATNLHPGLYRRRLVGPIYS